MSKSYQAFADCTVCNGSGFIILGRSKQQCVSCQKRAQSTDMVNHPSHYTAGGIETIDFIEAKQLDFHSGNVVKYVSRANHKGKRLEDLKKAQWYLNRLIARLEDG